MHKVKTICVAVASLAAIAVAFAAAPAFAEEGFLGTNELPWTYTIKSGAGVFQSTGGGLVAKGTVDEGTGTVTSPTLGKFDVLFLGVNVGGIKCTGLDDTVTGSVLAKGDFHIYTPVATPLVAYAVLLLLTEVHFECLGILTSVRGSVIGKVTSPSGQTGSGTISLKQTKGVNEFTEVEGKKFNLESETNGGAFEQSGEETTETLEKFVDNKGTAFEAEFMY